MKIYGIIIPEKVIEACFKRMTEAPFIREEIADIAVDMGVPRIAQGNQWFQMPVAYRCADRLIQKARRAKIIRYEKKKWIPTV